MTFVKINQTECTGCKACMLVCPSASITYENNKAYIPPNAICIKCLHCAASCPYKAIERSDGKPALIDRHINLSLDFSKQLEDFILARRSIRNFSKTLIKKDLLENVLEYGAWAPSAKNEHPLRWVVIHDNDKLLEEMMSIIIPFIKKTGIFPEVALLYERGINRVFGNSHTIILACARKKSSSPQIDATLALHNIELLLQAKGIGTCWSGYMTELCTHIEELPQILKVPKSYQVYGSLLVGYPQKEENYINIPDRSEHTKIMWL